MREVEREGRGGRRRDRQEVTHLLLKSVHVFSESDSISCLLPQPIEFSGRMAPTGEKGTYIIHCLTP